MLFLHGLLSILWAVSTVSTVYLYIYPWVHGCGFPTRDGSFDPPAFIWGALSAQIGGKEKWADTKAPFRLLALGDPQLEGDTSIPNATDGYFPTLRGLPSDVLHARGFGEGLAILRNASYEIVTRELPAKFQALRKQVDLFGNDYYLAHIYRTLHLFTHPTHVTVLGDLLGSQWIDDEEFERRGWRFWNRVFRHGQKVEEVSMKEHTQEVLGDDKNWERRIINVVGNHDVGYAGDMTVGRIERFEKLFGKANWEVTFRLGPSPSTGEAEKNLDPVLRLVILNSMNLDTPAKDQDLQSQTYREMNDVIARSRPVEDSTSGTILLTHIPLHKEAGVCVDSPFFDFHSDEDGGGLKEQNHISYDAGKSILEGLYGMSGNPNAPGRGMGRNGIILAGHDHEGCDVYHYLPAHEDMNARRWNATKWEDAKSLLNESIPGIREVTVRSMMGDFGGNAGLLSAWFDYDVGEWRFAYSTCSIGVQHIWWAVHVLFLVTVGFTVFAYFVIGLDTPGALHGGKEHRQVANIVDEDALVATSGCESLKVTSSASSIKKRTI
ncbi:hypothetical protein MMC11_001831 [Xylographa trunciseda]|nr:hypothetical protein [Xylographa trunciseda]